MKKINTQLLSLIKFARLHGLNEHDLKIAQEFLDYNEFGLCFETIVSQMLEQNIATDQAFYDLVSSIGKTMNLEQESFSFMQELIKDDVKYNGVVKDEHYDKENT